ncbi:MAG: hypothetical protein A2Y38_25390 [Spirochaetes bacterium GWB1_59_5]|nr:MAG: hypothetical protein A2Y38_25390 [Spirochaetes bacterium GWB1_59_5]
MKTVDDYIANVAPDKREILAALRKTIRDNLSPGLSEELSYGMIGYVVPLSTYPAGYHCDPSLPVPFINLGAQKHCISLYHLGLYAVPSLHEWFISEYQKLGYRHKMDMGKSCIRFKYFDEIPYALIKELVGKMTLAEWLELYETSLQDRKTMKTR